MEVTQIRSAELLDSCRILFGRGTPLPPGFLDALSLDNLKETYRRRALETHPDRSAFLLVPEDVLAERFKELTGAYDRLRRYLEDPSRFLIIDGEVRTTGRGAGTHRTGRPGTARRRPDHGRVDHYFRGRPPQVVLPIGRFLYYSGHISMRHLIDALVWQRRQRPVLGVMALKRGWLTPAEVRFLLLNRHLGERFGERAVRAGLLRDSQVRHLLAMQRLLQPRLGRYFVEAGILTAREVEELVRRLRLHNLRAR